MGRDRESQTHIHAAGEVFNRCIDETLDLGKSNDLVKLAVDLLLLHAKDSTVEIDIFPPGQFRVKPGADLKERANATVNRSKTLGRTRDARQDFEQRALAGAIRADDADNLTAANLERY